MEVSVAGVVTDIHVFIVDDDSGARTSLGRLVSSFSLEVSLFSSGKELIDALPENGRCLVISDVRMFDMPGMEILSWITQHRSEIPVVLVSAYADVDMTVRAMRSGAVAVLRKPYSEEELWDAIRVAVQANDAALSSLKQKTSLLDRLLTLSEREMNVLKCIADGKQHKQCAADLGWSLRTIEKYRAEALRKLGMTSPYELVREFMVAGLTEWPDVREFNND